MLLFRAGDSVSGNKNGADKHRKVSSKHQVANILRSWAATFIVISGSRFNCFLAADNGIVVLERPGSVINWREVRSLDPCSIEDLSRLIHV